MGTATGASTSSPVQQVLVANAAAPSLARRFLRRWLVALPWPTDECDDLLLAASEAVSNVVDHAYPPAEGRREVTMTAELRRSQDNGDRVIITVSDSGTGRPVPSRRGYRGRGLRMMRACTGSLRIDATGVGTRVTMTSRPAWSNVL
jgi:anti-sigma regulatory factor (Ser/Thr protein kinase)